MGRCQCSRHEDEQGQPITVRYRNWRGETAIRTIVPIRIWHGATEWHPEAQWLMEAVDSERGVVRDFALRDMNPAASAGVAPAADEAERRDWVAMRDRAEQAEAAIKRVRGLVVATRDATAAGRNDWQIGQHDLADTVLAVLDGAVPPAAAPAVDRAALRDRIAQVVRETVTRVMDLRGFDTQIADAVLSVVPDPASTRAETLRDAADTVEAMNDGCGQTKPCASCNAREDAAGELRRLADEVQPETDTEAWDVPDARPGTTDHTLTRRAATVDPAMCPRCKGDNREAFALCPSCAEADGRLLCPRCRTDITDYAEDDHVFRTGDERPYCSGECVVAAHRAAAREQQSGAAPATEA